jgi:hypothetical protein
MAIVRRVIEGSYTQRRAFLLVCAGSWGKDSRISPDGEGSAIKHV